MAEAKKIKCENWQQADELIKAIGILERQKERLRLQAEERIKNIREKLKEKTSQLQAQMEVIKAELEEFARAHRTELEPLKSKQLTFGKIGFRNEPKFSWPKRNAELVKRLKSLKLFDYIRIKEEPDKALIIAHWEKLDLKGLGVKRTVEEVFYVEPKREKNDL